jgi:long-chain-fatty-acid---luciferin-component ligase
MSAAAATIAHRLEREVIAATTDLDHVIFGEGMFDLPLSQQRALREVHVREALAHHLACCPAYADFARRQGFVAGADAAVLHAIPVIPTAVFKRRQVISTDAGEVAKWCLSSGTRGAQSRVGRDRMSLERLLGSVRAGITLIDAWEEDDLEVVHLGPDRQEAGDIWFLYVMSLIELLYPTRHFVRHGRFDAQGAIARILEVLERSDRHIGVVGPPFRVMELIESIESSGTRVDAGARMTVLTAGGWKRLAGGQISREALRERVCSAMGLQAASQVRDAFNQVELNTVFVECAAHRLHVPPWVCVMTRDARDLQPQSAGTAGVLSYLDASATSYPAFLVTDDVGTVHEGRCACGREGVTLQVERRLARITERGCSLALDRPPSAAQA